MAHRHSTVIRGWLVVAALVVPAALTAAPPFPPAAPESQGIPAEALGALAEAVRGYVEKDHAVGGELLVIKNRRTVLHEAFGSRDRDAGVPLERDTIFNIRSMTKPLTGAAAQILIDEGRLRLDDPVAMHLVAFRNERTEMITIEQLLTHRSGLPLTGLTAEEGIRGHPDLQAIAAAIGERGGEFEPGSKFWYSDAGSEVLGAVVEVVSGQRLDEFVEERLLRPLGMNDTFYFIDAHDGDPRLARIATLYAGSASSWTRFWGPEDGPLYPFAWGSQTLYGTPRDYARFLAMWMDDGRAGGRVVLSPAAIERTLTPVSDMTSLGSDMHTPTFFPGLEVTYGQMSMLYVEAGAPEGAAPIVIGHGGSDGTMAWAWPERDLMVLYFTQSRGGLSVLRLEGEIDRHLLNPGRVERVADIPAEYEPYLGTYVANFGPYRETEFTVLMQNENLAVDIPGQLVFELAVPDESGHRAFLMTDQVKVSFDHDEAGAVVGMKVHQGGMTFELPKGKANPKPIVEIDPALLTRYLGTYRDPEAGRNVEFVVHNDRLAIEVPGQPMPLEFYPPDESGLWAMRLNISVKVRFDENDNGDVVSYTVVLPDGREMVRPRVDPETAEAEAGG